MKNMLKELPPIFEVKQEDKKEVNRFLNLHENLIEYLDSIVTRLKNIVSKIFKINLKILGESVSYRDILALEIFVLNLEETRKIDRFDNSLYRTDDSSLVDLVLLIPEVQ